MATPGDGRAELGALGAGAGLMVGGRLAGRGLGFLVAVILARSLGAGLFGIYTLGWTLLRAVGALATLGNEHGVLRFAAPNWPGEKAAARRIALRGGAVAVAAGAAAGLGLFLAAGWLEARVFALPGLARVLRLVAVALPLLAGARVLAAGTRVSRDMRPSVWAEDVTQPAAHLLFLGLALAVGWGLLGAVGALVASYGVSLALAAWYLRRLLGGAAPGDSPAVGVRELVAFSFPAALAGALGNYVLWVDRLILGAFRSAAEVGVYQVAMQLSAPFVVVVAALGAAIAPLIPAASAGEAGRLGGPFRACTRWGLDACLALFLVVALAGSDLVLVLFGGEYHAAVAPLVVLAAARVAVAAAGPAGMVLILSGRQRRWLAITGGALAAGVLLQLALVPRFGMLGAAVATGTALVAMNGAALVAVWGELAVYPWDRGLAKGLLAAGAAAVAGVAVRLLGLPPGAPRLLLVTVACLAVFTAALLAQGLDPEDRLLLARLGRRRGAR